MRAGFAVGTILILSGWAVGTACAQQPSPAQTASPKSVAGNPAGAVKNTLVIPAGTRMALVLHNAISTRSAKQGDPVFLETVFPIVENNRILVPAGSYVQGEVTEAKRPGRVHGRGEIRVRLTTMILPNGYTVRLDAIPTNAGTGGGETTTAEGQVNGDTSKGADAGTVIETTTLGAGVGGIAGRGAAGAGIGAAAGAAAGLAAVLLTRGPEVQLPRGTSVEIALDRPVYLDGSKIHFTDAGHASDLAGPAIRQQSRSRLPF